MMWFKLVCYLIFIFGITVIMVQSTGPFDIFYRIRLWTEENSEKLHELVTCPLCFPTNVGIVFSLVDWFLLNGDYSPFNIIMHDNPSLWFVAAIMDGCLAGGFCHFVWNIDDFIDKSTPIFEDEIRD